MNLFRAEALGRDAMLFRGFATSTSEALLAAVTAIERVSPFRQMRTPGGLLMSVALSNCGTYGWTSDQRGYRYTRDDTQTGLAWPAMPAVFGRLAGAAAEAAGYTGFAPDACLINRYLPGSRLSLHQDKNEADFSHPIVSVSLGMTATFQFGGLARAGPCARVMLEHGDVAVWGGVDRLRYHGVMPLKGAAHPVLGAQRINLTFRRAGQTAKAAV
jgi:alkylated DNA repair protein (DNA oxidative demethylase)